jgi:hypothetical protein
MEVSVDVVIDVTFVDLLRIIFVLDGVCFCCCCCCCCYRCCCCRGCISVGMVRVDDNIGVSGKTGDCFSVACKQYNREYSLCADPLSIKFDDDGSSFCCCRSCFRVSIESWEDVAVDVCWMIETAFFKTWSEGCCTICV